MSYEGFEQHICSKGHRYDTDCGFNYGDYEKCSCGAESVFCNCVDQTNGPSQGKIINWEYFTIVPEQKEECKCCGHVKTVVAATYRIPSKDELELFCVYDCEICNDSKVYSGDEMGKHYNKYHSL